MRKLSGLARKMIGMLRVEVAEIWLSWQQGVPLARIARLFYVNLRYRTQIIGGGKGALRKRYPHLHVAHIGPRPDMLAETRSTRIDRLPLGWITPADHDALIVTCPADGAISSGLRARIQLYQQADKPVVLILPDGAAADPLLAALEKPPSLICTATEMMAENSLVLPPAINLHRTSPMGFPLKARGELGVAGKAGHASPDYGPDTPPIKRLQWSDPAALPALADKARKLRGVICDPAACPDAQDFARQVTHLAGAGTVILYPESAASQMAPLIGAGNGLPFSAADDLAQISTQLADPVARERQSVATRRHILQHHTHLQRLEMMLAHLGIPTRPAPLVSIIACTMRPDYLPRFLAMIRAQDWPAIELILITHGSNFDEAQIAAMLADYPLPITRISCPQSMIFGDCLNMGIDAARGQYIAKLDDDDFYGPEHIRDLVQAHDYAHAEATGKAARFFYLAGMDVLMSRRASGEMRTNHVSGAAFMLTRKIARDYMFLRVARGIDRTLFQRVAGDGKCLYEAHAFGFCVYRGVSGHTWVQEDEVFLRRAVHQWAGFNPALTRLGDIAATTSGKADAS